MPTTDPRVDAYLASAPDFARGLLAELRTRVHRAVPDVQETIKWRAPSFECGGLLGGMAAFRRHCAFVFWKEQLLLEDATLAEVVRRCGRISVTDDLPSATSFAAALRRARELNEAGVKVPRAKVVPRPDLVVPPEFAKALARAKPAKAHFDRFAPSHQREYLQWILDCKRPETRQRRIEQAIEWLAEGRTRNWKYERR
jgi:uncharacterized protein YdeI (YjbR/CyaY-like superfamily)